MTEPSRHSATHGDQRLAPGQVVDRYVVDGVIGTGGTAAVYRVRHAQLGTVYALKVLALISPAIRRRTLQEGRVQATLRHRNIVGVYDVLEIGDAPGLLMEFVHGPSLETALQRHRFTLEHAELIFRGILSGVQLAHEHGLVHRDLKPANVLLAETGDGLVPKVTDFGIAKVVEGDQGGHTRQGVAMGTPQYMAPEQIRDARSVDARADIFSLGCILYELVTGRRAFPQDDILKVYNAICDGEVIPPRQLVPELPERIAQAILGALAVDRDSRIPNAETLLAVFEGRASWNVEEPTELMDAGVVDDLQAGPFPSQDTFLPADLLAELGDDDLSGESLASATSTGTLDADATPAPDATLDAAPAPQRARQGPMRRAAAVFAMLGSVMLASALWLRLEHAAPPDAGTPPRTEDALAEDALAEDALAEPELAPSAPSDAVPPAPPDAAPRRVASAPADPSPPPPRTPALEPPPARPTAAPPLTAAAPPPRAGAPSPSLQTVRLLALPRTAELTVDGKDAGRTPGKLDLAPGRHDVAVRSGDLEGRFSIDVKAGADNKWCYVFEEDRAIAGSCPR